MGLGFVLENWPDSLEGLNESEQLMTTTWTIAIDWDRNGNFTGTYDDVTSYVISAEWVLGIQRSYQDCADNSVLKLVLNNADKRFSPENGSSPIAGKILPFRPAQIQSNDGTTTRTHWVGWVETIQPTVGRYGERQVQIVGSGALQFFKAAESKLSLQENKTTDQILAELIKEVVVPPSLAQAWILGQVGNSEVGATTYLADTTAYSTLDTGKLTLGMAADNWVTDGGPSNISKNAFDVYQGIQDIVAAEHGRFLFDRSGKAIFWNRHHLLQGATSAATFNDTMVDMAYTYAGIDRIKNEVIVNCHPRTITANTDNVLWDLGDAVIRVDAGQTRELYVKYADTEGKRTGAKDVTVTDVTFQSGTASAAVTASANGATLKFTNSGTEPAIVSGCKVRGRKIVDAGQMEAKAIDNSSIISFGRRSLRLNLPSIDNLEQAQYIADFERDRRKSPKGEVNTITVASHGKNGGSQHAHQLARTLGDMITVTETQTGHSENYFIIGEAHELTDSATFYKTTWYLEIAPDTFPWQLGVAGRSELGTATTTTY